MLGLFTSASTLGGKTFIRDVSGRVKIGITEKQETSHRRDLQTAYVVDRVIDAVAAHFKIPPDDVKENNGEYRNIVIHLLKK